MCPGAAVEHWPQRRKFGLSSIPDSVYITYLQGPSPLLANPFWKLTEYLLCNEHYYQWAIIIWCQDRLKIPLLWHSQQVAKQIVKPSLSHSEAYCLFASFFWIFRLTWNSSRVCLSLSYIIISMDRYINNTKSFGLYIQAIKDLWDRIREKKVEIL